MATWRDVPVAGWTEGLVGWGTVVAVVRELLGYIDFKTTNNAKNGTRCLIYIDQTIGAKYLGRLPCDDEAYQYAGR